ncbi:hypothetical protein FS749_012766 [Ceratobasidium sp. UAMH 11750]|nr:hypothetical protein FS749_012766 [Ceratobasidium sp. UAMH 11750]
MARISKDSRRPLMPARKSSVRSSSSSSSRSFTSWDPDASVRMFMERSREASTFDEDCYPTDSESGFPSGRSSPEPYPPTPIGPPLANDTTAITERNTFSCTFFPDMPTSDLVAAAREAADAVTMATRALDSHTSDESPLHFVGFGTLSRDTAFRRPVRASANRYAASTRRFVDILT